MKTTLYIQNLKCGGCEATIYNKIKTLENIKNIFVSVDESAITFDHYTDLDLAIIKETLFKIGYPVLGEENKLMTKAKSYVSCAVGRMKK